VLTAASARLAGLLCFGTPLCYFSLTLPAPPCLCLSTTCCSALSLYHALPHYAYTCTFLSSLSSLLSSRRRRRQKKRHARRRAGRQGDARQLPAAAPGRSTGSLRAGRLACLRRMLRMLAATAAGCVPALDLP